MSSRFFLFMRTRSHLNEIQKWAVFKVLSSDFYFHPLYVEAFSLLHSMGRESIREYQLYRLQRLLLRARRDVPYWREVIGTRLLRGDSLDIGEFAHLPILTRETLRNRHREFIIKNLDRYKHRTFVTSGSTDVPKKFVADKPFCQKIMAVEACYVRRFGVKDYRQFGFFLNKPHLADLTTQIDPFTSNAEELNKIFMEKDIRAVGGAVYRLLRLAEMVESGKVRVNLTFVLAGSEYLSPERKRYFEKVFRCPVYNKYVCAEAGMIGVECTESGGFHIDPVNTYVEIVDENGVPITDGRSGRIVITVFNNRLMPLIRYELGDTGKWVDETKSCGGGLGKPHP